MLAQKELKSLIVRPIESKEEVKWNQLMNEHHYLVFRQIVGESIKYVAVLNDQWVALLGWGAAAFKCGSRDKWIGWSREQQWRRLIFIANNSRFLILPQVRIPNLASKILSLNLRRLSKDWMEVFGHPIVLAETFVDHSRFSGTCYRAAGWIQLGQTRGFGRNGGKYYHHGLSKTIYVYPLHRKARQLLSNPFLAPELMGGQKPMLDLNKVNLEQRNGLLIKLQQLKDPRKRRGIRHSSTSTLAVSVCAVLSGARNFLAIGEWAKDLPQDLLRRLRCRFHPEKRIYIPPSEPTIRRHLRSIDADEFDRIISEWFAQQTDSDAVAVDGKTLKGARCKEGKKLHLMSAILHKEGVVIAQKAVDNKTNEIPTFQTLLDPVDLKGMVVTADAMHTQVEHAIYLKEQKEADYLFTVKGNQKTLLNSIEDLDKDDFFP